MMSSVNAARINAFWGALVGDALAMPAHWFYRPTDLPRFLNEYVSKYHAAPEGHSSSILQLSAVDTSGRAGSNSKGQPVIGHIILHDKLEVWKNGKSNHYHQGMKAGDNTLNSLVAALVLDVLVKSDPDHCMDLRDLRARVLESYVTFMTTPGTHNDTYAESWHRAFFRDWAVEEPRPTSAADLLTFAEQRSQRMEQLKPDSQIMVISGITSALPWIVHFAAESEDRVVEAAVEFVRLSHPCKGMSVYIELFARCLYRVIHGQSPKEVAREALLKSKVLGMTEAQLAQLTKMVQKHPRGSSDELAILQGIAPQIGMECYIRGSLPLALLLVYLFHDDFRAGVMMNVNIGGDNCHRAAVVGSLLGASGSIPEDLKFGLNSVADRWNSVRSLM